MIDAPIKALAPWFGAKRSLAADILPHFGPHDSYLEPFGGSMAMLFAKPPAKLEIVNDLNRHITNLGWCLQSESACAALLRRLRRSIPTEAHFRDCAEAYRFEFETSQDAPNVNAAAIALSAWWIGHNGFAGTDRTPGFAVRFSPTGGNPSIRWASVLRSLSSMARRLRGAIVTNRDAADLIAAAPDRIGQLIYPDPPYIRKTCNYEHDFAGIREGDADTLFGRDDRLTHEGLAKLLNRFERTRVVLSYYDEPELADFYPSERWRKVLLTGKKAMANATGGAEVESPEILLINDARIAA